MTQSRIEGKFYPLQTPEWIDICKSLTKSQMSVLFYIRSVDPYDNGISIKSSHIAELLEMTKRAVNAALAVLRQKGYIKSESVEHSIKVNAGGCHCDTFSTGTVHAGGNGAGSGGEESPQHSAKSTFFPQHPAPCKEHPAQNPMHPAPCTEPPYNQHLNYSSDTSSSGTEVGNSVPTREQDFSPENRNSHSGNSVPTREENFSPENRISHPEPETVTEQGFEKPKTLKSSQDIEDTTDKKVGVKEIFEKYYERLRLYGMYKEVWDGEKLVINQKMVDIQKAVFHVPLQKIEAGLRAFCAWMREAKGVRNKYKALETSILRGWEI